MSKGRVAAKEYMMQRPGMQECVASKAAEQACSVLA